MKKIVAPMIAIICGCLLPTSCKEKTDTYERDHSLAGSISFSGYRMDLEGSFDGHALDSFQYDWSFLDIRKVSDTKISLFCYSKWGETILRVSIPVIALSGKPHDATFNGSSNDAVVTYDDTEYTSVSTTINGWIKEVGAQQSPSNNVQLSSTNGGDADPATPHYLCEIAINCNVDGKALILKINAVKPF